MSLLIVGILTYLLMGLVVASIVVRSDHRRWTVIYRSREHDHFDMAWYGLITLCWPFAIPLWTLQQIGNIAVRLAKRLEEQ